MPTGDVSENLRMRTGDADAPAAAPSIAEHVTNAAYGRELIPTWPLS